MKYLKLYENMTNTKMVHHMTLAEYKSKVAPLIIELKKIFRKKFLLPNPNNFYGIDYLPKEEWVEVNVQKYLDFLRKNRFGESTFDKKGETEKSVREWYKKGGKDKVDEKLYQRYLEIKGILEPLYLEPSKVDLAKAHKDNKKEVREALTSDTYVNEIKKGELDYKEMEEICSSHKIRIPKRVVELKQRYEGKGKEYARNVMLANKKFISNIREHLSQYVEELKDIKRNNLTRRVDRFIENNPDRYSREYGYDPEIGALVEYNERESKWVKKEINFRKETLKRMCEEYAESYISTFISRLENKTNLINTNLGIPSIEFDNTSFRSGELETDFTLTYSNGTKLTGHCNVIIAGGYVQRLHQRYLFHFYLNGKKVSLEQIDKFQ